ncbi:helix-turn-helix domain-containing protein, partial [Chromobacterium piscinae]|uniref:helix-turn-helix domain-containing protein n=2 Tax=Chromobacterium piscinae TaxID=686831 RepID=UPI0032603956
MPHVFLICFRRLEVSPLSEAKSYDVTRWLKYLPWIFIMSVSLDDLELLLDVAALGSFSQAAARRGWSQPQASQRVALLETRLGVKLFSRHRRGAEPTAACMAFLPAARAALDALAEGRER